MKIKKLFLKIAFCLSLFIFNSSFSYGQSWMWGAAGYGSLKSNVYGLGVATDQLGNAYVTGYFNTSATFGAITLTNTGYNAFLTKYNASGSVQWAIQPTDSGYYPGSYGQSVATDGAGNIYATGVFNGAITFGSFTLRVKSMYYYTQGLYLVKYAPNGNIIWAVQSNCTFTGNPYPIASSIAIDKNNNVFITGSFEDTIYFGANRLTTLQQSAFIVKYDASGNIDWAAQSVTPSNNSSCEGNSVAIDREGNAYIAGTFRSAVFWGAYHLISLNNPSAFLVKYSPSGTLLWATQSININNLQGAGYASSIITDEAGNPYVTGYFSDSIKFGSHILYSPTAYYYTSFYSTFLTKYDTNGNVIWAKQSSLGLQGSSLTSDKISHIYLGGFTESYQDTVYNFGTYALHAVSWAGNNAFLLKFDTSGTAVCGSMLENAGFTSGVGIASDSGTTSGNYLYMTSSFLNDTVFCGPDTLFTSNNDDGTNIFVGRWLNCGATAGIADVKTTNEEIKVYPNPSNGMFTLAISHPELVSGSQTIEVYNMLGEKVYCETLKQVQGDNNINLSTEPNGIYLYRVITETGELVGEGKVVIQR